ncbi:unnamed protein product, partial [Rhizoctonia solani]
AGGDRDEMEMEMVLRSSSWSIVPYIPVPRILSSQPTIEELSIICQLDDLSTLGPEALPALKKLAAPLPLLLVLLPHRFSQLALLNILDTITTWSEWLLLGTILSSLAYVYKPPESLTLSLRTEISVQVMPTSTISAGLHFLGQLVPFINSLKLHTYGVPIRRDELQNMFAPVLAELTNLKSLSITTLSLAPSTSIYTPQAQPSQAPPVPGLLTPNVVAPMFDELMTHVSTMPRRPLAPIISTHDTPLHGLPHMETIEVWYRACPNSGLLSFPVTVVTHSGRNQAVQNSS